MYGNFNGNGKEFYLGDNGCEPIIDHCDLQGGINALGGPGSGLNYDPTHFTNTIDSNPFFALPSVGTGNGYNGLTADWSLQSSSPCINAGDTTGVSNFLPNLDLGNNARINGTIDMGAYEYTLPIPALVTVASDTVANGQSACYNATQTITVAGNGNLFKVEDGGSVELIAGQNIIYLSGTTVGPGGYMYGHIAADGPWCITPNMMVMAATGATTAVNPVEPGSWLFMVYPNPTDGDFTIALPVGSSNAFTKVTIYGFFGEKIMETSMDQKSGSKFSLSGRPAGVYYIRVETGRKAMTGKLVKL